MTKIRAYAFYGKNALTSVTSYIENPSAITTDVFGSWYGNTYDAPLYVPMGTSGKYKSTDGWKNFKNIVEMAPTGIKDLENDNIIITRYYTIDGKQLNGKPVKAGMYIVRMNDGTMKKIMVK